MKKYIVALCLLFAGTLSAQPRVEMADDLRSSGMIYVVVAVIAVIFLGLLAFLVSIDRKISALEKTSFKSK